MVVVVLLPLCLLRVAHAKVSPAITTNQATKRIVVKGINGFMDGGMGACFPVARDSASVRFGAVLVSPVLPRMVMVL